MLLEVYISVVIPRLKNDMHPRIDSTMMRRKGGDPTMLMWTL